MNRLLNAILENNRKWIAQGDVALYIPELSKIDKNLLGISVCTLGGEEYWEGDAEVKFTIQSISKIVTLMLAIIDNGEDYVFLKVGMEPTETAFNSIVNLEAKESHKPINPMINAGAIVVASMVDGRDSDEKFDRILKFTRKISGNNNIDVNLNVYKSEKETGDRNRALAYFMKSTGTLEGNVEEILDVYFKQCSIEVTCKDLARIGVMLANDGVSPYTGDRIIPRHVARIVKTIMVTCGMYDASGNFAVHIGMPAKSGVGGGILACAPRRMGIGVLGTALDEKGNSISGTKILEELSKQLDLSIF